MLLLHSVWMHLLYIDFFLQNSCFFMVSELEIRDCIFVSVLSLAQETSWLWSSSLILLWRLEVFSYSTSLWTPLMQTPSLDHCLIHQSHFFLQVFIYCFFNLSAILKLIIITNVCVWACAHCKNFYKTVFKFVFNVLQCCQCEQHLNKIIKLKSLGFNRNKPIGNIRCKDMMCIFFFCEVHYFLLK